MLNAQSNISFPEKHMSKVGVKRIACHEMEILRNVKGAVTVKPVLSIQERMKHDKEDRGAKRQV